jgi:hypothetical protein
LFGDRARARTRAAVMVSIGKPGERFSAYSMPTLI